MAKPYSKTMIKSGDAKPKVAKPKEPQTKPQTHATTLAGDKFFKVNWPHPELKKAFPYNVKMWTVDKFYPYAKDGPLFIDEPRFEHEIKRSMEKAAVLAKSKARFVILKNGVEQLQKVS